MSALRRPFLILSCSALYFASSSAPAENLGELRGIFRASFNHDASRVIVRGREGAVTIWEIPAGTRLAGDVDPNAASDGFLMSADSKLVLIGFKDGGSRVFDATTAKAISPPLDLPLKADFQMPALFSPDGGALVVFTEKEAVVFNVADGKRVTAIPLPAGPNEDTPGSAAFAADGTQCFIMDGAGSVTRFNTKDWKPNGKAMKHPAAESAYDFEFSISDDGKWLATADGAGENGPKGNLQVWDAAANKPVGKPLVAVNGLAARFFGTNRVVIMPGRGEANVRDLPSMKVLYPLRKHDDVDGPKADVSPDGKWVLAWGHDRNFERYDAATGKLAGNQHSAATISKVIIAPDSAGCFVVFDNSAFVVEGHYDYYIVKYDFPELNLANSVRTLDFVLNVSLSGDGKRLLVVQGRSDEERILFFDAATLKPLN